MRRPARHPGAEHAVRIAIDHVALDGELAVPPGATGVVLFAHGGCSHPGPDDAALAGELRKAGLATLRLGLLTAEEERGDDAARSRRLDVRLLAERLAAATDWVAQRSAARRLPVGYLGTGAAAAAALVAAAGRPGRVRAVVSCDGRPELAGTILSDVQAPTLLVVGGADPTVVAGNRDALDQLRTRKRLAVVAGAPRGGAEPGAWEVRQLVRDWFVRSLAPPARLPYAAW